VGLAGPGAADQHDVALVRQELAASQVAHQGLIDRCAVKGEVVDVLGQRQLGDGDLVADGPWDSPSAAIIVSLRGAAVTSDMAEAAPTQRERHLHSIAKLGRTARRTTSGCTKQSRIDAAICRFKQVIGDGIRSRTDDSWRSKWRLPFMFWTIDWSWDLRSRSALPDFSTAGLATASALPIRAARSRRVFKIYNSPCPSRSPAPPERVRATTARRPDLV
jgi:hypothetical protein